MASILTISKSSFLTYSGEQPQDPSKMLVSLLNLFLIVTVKDVFSWSQGAGLME